MTARLPLKPCRWDGCKSKVNTPYSRYCRRHQASARAVLRERKLKREREIYHETFVPREPGLCRWPDCKVQLPNAYCSWCPKHRKMADQERRRKYQREYRKHFTPGQAGKQRACNRASVKAWCAQHPEARRDSDRLAADIKAGRVKRPDRCPHCPRSRQPGYPVVPVRDGKRRIIGWACWGCYWKLRRKELSLPPKPPAPRSPASRSHSAVLPTRHRGHR
jgi:hypothetical protein